jgi:hypothetical protein
MIGKWSRRPLRAATQGPRMPVNPNGKFKPAPARTGLTLADCDFYHTTELPGGEVIQSQWDLRGREADYLGHIPLAGRSVLEIGPASGHLSFWMEDQGAAVTAFDLSHDSPWDFVPFKGLDLDETHAVRRQHLHRLQNAWWFLREAKRAKAEAVYGTVYDIDPSLGTFDVVTLNSVLLHLRDPMGAMIKAASVCSRTLVITEVHEEHYNRRTPWKRDPMALSFLPRADRPQSHDAWFVVPSGITVEMMRILGFRTTLTRHKQTYQHGQYRMYTVVGERV